MGYSSALIESWLKVALAKCGIAGLSAQLAGNTGPGEGYMGDVLFVHVSGHKENGDAVEYDLVLKCSKTGEYFRLSIPVRDAFLNEIHFYEKILPTFNRFERECGIEKPFGSVPKYYGNFIGDSVEVIVFEDLKKTGHDLWDSRMPLSRERLELIVGEYGKYHAISVAMRDQQPKQYQELCDGVLNVWERIIKSDMGAIFPYGVEWIYKVLHGTVDESILTRWLKLKEEALDALLGVQLKPDALRVIVHGDCWNNNYMHRFVDHKVAFLDWQAVMLGSPALDLSYFLFACISKTDIEDMDAILKYYYDTFSNYVRQLGSDPERLYPFKQFLTDWKLYSKHGLVMSITAVQTSLVKRDQAVNLAAIPEQGEDYSTVIFDAEMTDPAAHKDRMKYIIEYAANHDILP